jgi:hypothetical protein
MSEFFSGGPSPFRVKSPFRVPWYKDKSYLALSVLSLTTVGFLTWFTMYQELNGRPELNWAGSGPKPHKRNDTNISNFRELMAEREAQDKKKQMKQAVEKKRLEKFKSEGHSHEE